MIKLVTIRTQILEVSDRWRRQYRYSNAADKEIIQEKLDKLNKKTATPEDLKKIIGNNSWACSTECGSCGKKSEDVIMFENKYEDIFFVCKKCLEKALHLINKEEK